MARNRIQPDSGSTSRAIAARVLAQVLAQKSSLPEAFARHARDADDQPFIRELCWGTARLAPRLDHLVRGHLKQPPRARDLDIQALMMIGAYQLGWMNVPSHACVHATVAATRDLGKQWARGLVNAVLRRLSEADLHTEDLPEEARYSHPQWLIGRLQHAYPDHWQTIIAAGNSRPPLTLRAHGDLDATRQALEDSGLEVHDGEVVPDALYVAPPRDVRGLPGFDSGRISVQDEGAQLAAVLLDPAPGERVLDACAAPGGKTLHLAQRAPECNLVAVESEARRGRLISENFARAGLTIEPIIGDARDPEPWWDGQLFDRILIDAPCTATGILRRQPDIRLLRREDDIAKLCRVQRELLEALWALLEPGGTLVYCTCSVLPEEGAMVVQAFVDAHPDALVSPLEETWGIAAGPGRLLLPSVDTHDGFFYSRLTRSNA